MQLNEVLDHLLLKILYNGSSLETIERDICQPYSITTPHLAR
jgi:hypothetical protein